MKTLFIIPFVLLLVSTSKNPFETRQIDEPEEMKGMVNQHNVWRKKVGVPPLAWSDDLAAFAQVWANHLAENNCEMKHRPRSGEFTQKYGENIYWCQGLSATPQMVVDSWASELADYNEKKNECKPGKVCGHYTQVVWSSTQQVGCAMAKCGDQEIWVCNYNPPGNWIGQRPYPKK